MLGIYKRDKTGGHAITPIAVEDRPNGVVAILLYDNNYPRTTRALLVDTTTNTWRYSGSTNPAVTADDYEGDGDDQTLELAPIAPRIPQQTCPFCQPANVGVAAGAVTRYNEFYLDGDADLLISEDQGSGSIGFVNGQPVNTLTGALARSRKYLAPVWENTGEPIYSIPTSTDVTVSIDGRRLSGASNSAVTMVGPGYALEVNDIMLAAGQIATLNVNTNGTQLRYTSPGGETPDMVLSFETPGADYALAVKGFDLAASDSVTLDVDQPNGVVRLRAATTQSAAFGLEPERIGTGGTAIFGTGTDVTIGATDVVYVKYAAWQGNGQPLEIQIDRGGDGTIDETQQLVDASDIFAE